MVVIPSIIVVVTVIVWAVRACKKKKQRQQTLRSEKEQEPPKLGSGQVIQNKMFEEDNSDPLYQDDIQYSERGDEYYMEPDEVRKPPRTELPPPLPSAPIPTIERDNEYNDPVMNPAIRTEQTVEIPRTVVNERDRIEEYEGAYQGGAYNNVPGVVHTIRPNRESNEDNVLQIKFTDPNIYENKM